MTEEFETDKSGWGKLRRKGDKKPKPVEEPKEEPEPEPEPVEEPKPEDKTDDRIISLRKKLDFIRGEVDTQHKLVQEQKNRVENLYRVNNQNLIGHVKKTLEHLSRVKLEVREKFDDLHKYRFDKRIKLIHQLGYQGTEMSHANKLDDCLNLLGQVDSLLTDSMIHLDNAIREIQAVESQQYQRR